MNKTEYEKKTEKIPTTGVCPLECFDCNVETSDKAGLKVPPLDIDKGICCFPTLCMAEGHVASEGVYINCAAMDTRASYLTCPEWLRWFWIQVAKATVGRAKQ